MDFLIQLWLPIVASATAVWFASFLSWAVLDIHKKDTRKLPDEEGFSAAVRGLGIPPGNYIFPFCTDKKQERDPAFRERMMAGPSGVLTLFGKISMGRNMLLTFAANLAASVLIAYLAWAALGAGADFMSVLRIVGTAGILAYSFGFLSHDIWFGASGRAIVLKIVDGVVYGLITGAIFAALWPSGPA
jgi:hypothetical protein